MSFLKNLEWRRAEKGFSKPSPTNPIPDIQQILTAIHQAPTSFGLQPFRVHVVTADDSKLALSLAAYNQPQITQCTHLLVFSARNDLDDVVDTYVKNTNASDAVESMIRHSLSNTSHKVHWAKHQAYIALGYALAAATELKIASCPMEGFSPDGVAAVLNLPHTLVPTALLALGLHDPSSPQIPRYRLPEHELIHWTTEEPTQVKPITSKYRRATPVRRRRPLEKIEG
jgi:nitroreductase